MKTTIAGVLSIRFAASPGFGKPILGAVWIDGRKVGEVGQGKPMEEFHAEPGLHTVEVRSVAVFLPIRTYALQLAVEPGSKTELSVVDGPRQRRFLRSFLVVFPIFAFHRPVGEWVLEMIGVSTQWWPAFSFLFIFGALFGIQRLFPPDFRFWTLQQDATPSPDSKVTGGHARE